MSVASKSLYTRLTPGGERNFSDDLRAENTGAVLLVLAAGFAMVWVNSPWHGGYTTLSEIVVGPSALNLDLTVSQWATDGLLAIFFFVVGLELKREMVVGQLRRPSTAIVPILAAVGGMAAPAAIYALVNATSTGGDMHGWAVPVATDIAFAVAVLTLFGKGLPIALRAFLLTLAVVDDLLGIVLIALFYAQSLQIVWLGAAFAAIAIFAVLVRRHGMTAWVLIPLAVAAWGFMHASGVHATIAGVVLGFTVPAMARPNEQKSLAEHFEHLWRPVSACIAVPVFALFAASVAMSPEALAGAAGDPVARGVVLGLVIGKPVGILLATVLLVKLTHASLDPSVKWLDLFAVSLVAGVGFTVSLLIGELSFVAGSPHSEHVKAAVLVGSSTSAALGGICLIWRSRVHKRQATVLPEQAPVV